MRDIVVILGAGASVEYRAPLMKDFYQVATRLFTTQYDNPKLKENFEIVFEFIDRLQKSQAKANLNLHNIEQIYSALEMAKLLKLNSLRVGRSWEAMDEAMKYFLTKTIEACVVMKHSSNFGRYTNPRRLMTMSHPAEQIDHVIHRLTGLKEAGWKVTFISFNYDLVVESVLATANYETDYGFANSGLSGKSLKLFKLHGSINWALVKQPRKSIIETVPMYSATGGVKHNLKKYFKVNDDNSIESNFCEVGSPFVIPPVWNKTTYQTQLSDVWRQAAIALSSASHVYSLGYSLPETDGFFKHLFALGTVGKQPLIEFGVFDIDPPATPNGVRSRYLSMLGRGAENVFTYNADGTRGLLAALNRIQ
jgi:hypothetical protein